MFNMNCLSFVHSTTELANVYGLGYICVLALGLMIMSIYVFFSQSQKSSRQRTGEFDVYFKEMETYWDNVKHKADSCSYKVPQYVAFSIKGCLTDGQGHFLKNLILKPIKHVSVEASACVKLYIVKDSWALTQQTAVILIPFPVHRTFAAAFGIQDLSESSTVSIHSRMLTVQRIKGKILRNFSELSLENLSVSKQKHGGPLDYRIQMFTSKKSHYASLIDCGCHHTLFGKGDCFPKLQDCVNNGVERIVVWTVSIEDAIEKKAVVENYPGYLYFLLGSVLTKVHRGNTEKEKEELSKFLKLLQHPQCLGITDAGIDYKMEGKHHDSSKKEDQIKKFDFMMSLAKEHKKCVFYASTTADDDCLSILKKYKSDRIPTCLYHYSPDNTCDYSEIDVVKFLQAGSYVFMDLAAVRGGHNQIQEKIISDRLIPVNKILLGSQMGLANDFMDYCEQLKNESKDKIFSTHVCERYPWQDSSHMLLALEILAWKLNVSPHKLSSELNRGVNKFFGFKKF